jgi:large subunit ribosomal protein L23
MQIIIKKPVITEKATKLSELSNRFTFEVDRKANKIEIKNAIEKMYGVHVTDVHTLNYGGGVSSVKNLNQQLRVSAIK